MEQTPKRRLIIRKKLVAKEELDESLLPPTTTPPTTKIPYGDNCTFYPVTESTKKKCSCGGEYTSDSEYTPRECCSGLYTSDRRYIWIDGRYTPDYIPVEDERKMAKEKFYSGFCKPVVYDFSSDRETSITKVETKQHRGFSMMPASQLRETQRDSRETQRDSRETQRDYRNTSRDSREHQRDSREHQRDYRNTSRDSREHYRDRDYHSSRDRDYERPRHRINEPNSHNGGRREPSKIKTGLDSELGTL